MEEKYTHQFCVNQKTIFFDEDSYDIWYKNINSNLVSIQNYSECNNRQDKSNNVLCEQVSNDELVKLTFLICETCNLQCKYCCGNVYSSNKMMNIKTAERVIRKFIKIYPGKIRSIVFFGGEPLLNEPVLWHSVKLIKKISLEKELTPPQLAIITNGTLIDDNIAKLIRENNIRITISLDGPKQVNDQQRITHQGHGTYDKIKHAIQILLNHNIPMNIEATYTQVHIDNGVSITETLRYLTTLGAKNIHLVPVCGTFPGLSINDNKLEELTSDFREAARFSIESLASDHPFQFKSAFYVLEALSLKGKMDQLCYAGSNIVSVHPDGNIYPCYLLHDQKFLMGNINEKSFFSDYISVKEKFKSLTKQSFRRCSNCWARNLCFSCYGVRYMDEKVLSPPKKSFCKIQQAIIEGALYGLVNLKKNQKVWNKALDGIVHLYTRQ